MFELLFKVWFLIAIMPFTIAKIVYAWVKTFFEKRNVKIGWLEVTLFCLVVTLIILLLAGYR